MTGVEQRDPDRSAPSPVVDLLDDYRHKQHALREQAEQVARLREEVLTAADREAAAIVAHARSEVRRVVVDAWRDVLALTTKLDAIADGDDHEREVGRVRDRLVETRRELHSVIEEARAELESLEQTAAPQRRVSDRPLAGAKVEDVAGTTSAAETPRSDPEPAEGSPDVQPGRQNRLVGRTVAALSLIASVAVTAALFFIATREDSRKASPAGRPVAATRNAQSLPPSSAAVKSPDSTTGAAAANGAQQRAEPIAVSKAGRQASGLGGEVATRTAAAKPASGTAPANQPTGQRPLGAPAPGAVATAGSSGVGQPAGDRTELTQRAERWLDAYYRGDGATTSSMSVSVGNITDERKSDERLPPGLAVKRSLEGLTFQFAGDTAILSGRMIEQAQTGAEPIRRVSWISQMWSKDSGEWKLMDVRMAGDIRRPPGPQF
jgi:hypothetical protein